MACYDATGGISMSNNDEEELEEEEPSLSPSLSEESMWQINLRSSDAGESGGPYPERPGEADCSYYIRTGLCRFGATCRFNHPPNRKLAIADNARMQGDQYPQRIGQPECQYYLMTGSCKFGGTCKFHHPRDKAGIAGRVPLNNLGYPIRPNEVECAYYLRTGQCKFGNTCKFHHPQPVNMMVSLRAAAAAAGYHSPTNQQSYIGGAASWSRGSTLVPSPRWHGPSSYAPLVLPQTAVVSLPGWNAYSSQLGPASSSSDRRVGNTQANYGTCSVNAVGRRTYYGLQQILQRDYINNNNNAFPERPEQPECQFYMKTGDCKFGAVCKFHHPRHRCIPPPDCLLSSIGLPLRPGEPICIFYSRYGICKFGPSCKFDHPMGVFANSNQLSAPGSPAVQLLFASSPSPSPSPEEDEEEEEEGQHLVQAGIRQRTRRMSVSSETMLSNSDSNFNTNQGMSI